MQSTPSRPIKKNLASWLCKSLGWLLAGIGFLCKALLAVWATLAIYFSNLPWLGCDWCWPWLLRRSAFGPYG